MKKIRKADDLENKIKSREELLKKLLELKKILNTQK
jgi:hypothetical protein